MKKPTPLEGASARTVLGHRNLNIVLIGTFAKTRVGPSHEEPSMSYKSKAAATADRACRTRYPDHPYHVRRVDGSAGLTVAYGHRFAVDREAKRNPIPAAFIFRHCSARPRSLPCLDGAMGIPTYLASRERMPSELREIEKALFLCGD